MSAATRVLLLLAVALLGSGDILVQADSQVETKSFLVQPGDTLVVNNDFGRVQIRAWEEPRLEARILKNTSAQSKKESLLVVSEQKADKVFVYCFFSGTPGESVDLEVQAPKLLNVVIWGANPEIDLRGIEGFVRAQNFTGNISAEDLRSSVSLLSDMGEIHYRAGVQPRGDVRLESNHGSIRCELANSLNLRCWIRARGTLSWDKEEQLRGSSIEKQLGTFGPLLYAGSLNGNVQVLLKQNTGSVETAAPKSSETRPEVVRQGSASQSAPAQIPDPVRTSPGAEPPAANPQPRAPSPAPEASTARTQPTALGNYSVKVDVDSVFLNVSVRDRTSNRSIAGLRKNDFQIYEDGVQQDVDQFLPTEAPFSLLLLLDVSGSTRAYLDLMKKASIDFIREIKENDQVAIATFNSRVRLVENFTNDRGTAARAISGVRSGGGTAFYDALMTCVDSYMRGMEGRKAIVVFTDGVDNQLEGNLSEGSQTLFPDLYRRIQEIDTIIYTIFLDTEGYVSPGRQPQSGSIVIDVLGDILGRRVPRRSPYPTTRRPGKAAVYEEAREQLLTIAEQTGGRMYTPQRIEDLASVYSEIADDLRIQYLLGYNSTSRAADGKWRSVRVTVVGHSEAAVRTRKGYYARRSNA